MSLQCLVFFIRLLGLIIILFSFRLMYYSTFTVRRMFMLISREEICCWVSRKAQRTRFILLILDWLPIIHKENTSQTQRKLTMEPLNIQAEMLILEVTSSSRITAIQRVKIGGGGYNSGKSFTVNACILK